MPKRVMILAMVTITSVIPCSVAGGCVVCSTVGLVLGVLVVAVGAGVSVGVGSRERSEQDTNII